MPSIRVYDRAVERLTRRELLKIAGTAGLAAIARPIVSAQTIARPLFRTFPFTLGVASGDPLPDGVVLWTRLAPEPLEGGGMPMTNVEVQWEIAADPKFANVARRGTELARPELGHSVHAEVSGSNPDGTTGIASVRETR
jgi:alkaline phosphatase D